jgi:hypothetical protein
LGKTHTKSLFERCHITSMGFGYSHACALPYTHWQGFGILLRWRFTARKINGLHDLTITPSLFRSLRR